MLNIPEAVQVFEDGTTDGVRVRRCGCHSPMCFDCMSGAAMRMRQRFLVDVDRLKVSYVCMLTVTSDPKRFPNPRHVLDAKIATKLMAELWQHAPRRLSEAFPVPTYWSFVEVQDGKRRTDGEPGTGNLHLHILLPAWNKTGRINRELLDRLRTMGIKLSGRTTWGWPGHKTHDGKPRMINAVKTAAGYASKAVTYASKGIGSVPDYMLDSERWSTMSRSRGVTQDDPANVESRERAAEKRAADSERRERCQRFMIEARQRRAYDEAKRWKRVRDGEDVERRTLSRKTHRQKIRECGDKSIVFDGDRFAGVVDLAYLSFWHECQEEMFNAWRDGADWIGGKFAKRLGFARERPRASFIIPRSLAVGFDALRAVLDSSLHPLSGTSAQKPGSVKGEAGRQNTSTTSPAATVHRPLRISRVSSTGYVFCRLTGSGVVLHRLKGMKGGLARVATSKQAILGGGGVRRPPIAGGGRRRRPRILVKKSLIGIFENDRLRAPP